MSYYLDVLRKYATFSGRATRSEYWYFVLFNLIFGVVLGVIGAVINLMLGGGETTATWLAGLYSLAVLLPSIAVSVRRLHDIGLSGLWVLLALVPLGGIALLIMYCIDTQPGANRFGPNPKGVDALLAQVGSPLSPST